VRTAVLGVYPFVPSAEAYLVVHVFWAVGRAFRSGTQDAWLYETLQARFDETQFARVESRGRMAKLVTDAVTAILGGVFYTIVRPVRTQYLNDRLDDVGRVTVLSGASTVLALVGGVARLVAG
jgi:hypothetical protein